MRPPPNARTMIAPRIMADSRAIASGSSPSNIRKLTRTFCRFCRTKTRITTSAAIPTMRAVQAPLRRVCRSPGSGDDSVSRPPEDRVSIVMIVTPCRAIRPLAMVLRCRPFNGDEHCTTDAATGTRRYSLSRPPSRTVRLICPSDGAIGSPREAGGRRFRLRPN